MVASTVSDIAGPDCPYGCYSSDGIHRHAVPVMEADWSLFPSRTAYPIDDSRHNDHRESIDHRRHLGHSDHDRRATLANIYCLAAEVTLGGLGVEDAFRPEAVAWTVVVA